MLTARSYLATFLLPAKLTNTLLGRAAHSFEVAIESLAASYERTLASERKDLYKQINVLYDKLHAAEVALYQDITTTSVCLRRANLKLEIGRKQSAPSPENYNHHVAAIGIKDWDAPLLSWALASSPSSTPGFDDPIIRVMRKNALQGLFRRPRVASTTTVSVGRSPPSTANCSSTAIRVTVFRVEHSLSSLVRVRQPRARPALFFGIPHPTLAGTPCFDSWFDFTGSGLCLALHRNNQIQMSPFYGAAYVVLSLDEVGLLSPIGEPGSAKLHRLRQNMKLQ
ncbi:hypothetical protein C8J57DRAFT_1593681 [Mycena rebaudengoi]|nr:hypothetical protein C8J57DRAFT_1593681 [Mycena rebaudengoi]